METNKSTTERDAQFFSVEVDASNEELIGLRRDALALAYDAIRGKSFPGFRVVEVNNPEVFAMSVAFGRGGNSFSISHRYDGAVLLAAKRRIEAEFKDQSIETKTVCEVRCDGASVTSVGSYISPLSDSTPGQTIWDLDYWRDIISSIRDDAAVEQELLDEKRSKSWISRLAGRLATLRA